MSTSGSSVEPPSTEAFMQLENVSGAIVPRPTSLGSQSHPNFLSVARDRLTVTYVGKGTTLVDVGAVRSDHPWPPGTSIGYFEVSIVDAGMRASIGIGISEGSAVLNRQPGWEGNSYGFSGEDGHKFHNSTQGIAYGPTLVTGDVLGCGLCFRRRELFFTFNGQHLGVAFRGVTGSFYPTIGLHSPGEIVSVNFGEVSPFRFDIVSYAAEECAVVAKEVESIPVNLSGVNSLICDYLLHSGYAKTYESFSSTCNNICVHQNKTSNIDDINNDSSSDPNFLLHERQRMRELILKGDTATVLHDFKRLYPDALYPQLNFQLACQAFIELIWSLNIEGAVSFMQAHLSPMYRPYSSFALSSDDQIILRDVVALLAYEDPTISPLAHLGGHEHREAIADAVNLALLKYAGRSRPSVFQSITKQLVASQWAIRQLLHAGRGSVFDLSEIIGSSMPPNNFNCRLSGSILTASSDNVDIADAHVKME